METSVTEKMNESDDVDRLFSIEAAAELLSISAWTVRKWITDGKIKSCKLGSRRVIPRSEIRRIIENSLQ